MAGILDLLGSDLGKTIISGVSNQTGQDTNNTGNVLTMAMPVLMQAMKRNASTSEGASGLLGALNSDKHNGSILDDLSGLFGGGVDKAVTDDGSKILGHILGNRQSNVTNAISQKSGVSASSVAEILKIAAPILMGFLGKQQRQQQTSQGGITDLLGGLLSNNEPQHQQSFLESMLDADGDGSVIDDVAGMVLGSGSKKKGGLGGLLGGLFGKK